jgi:hypothetical protein
MSGSVVNRWSRGLIFVAALVGCGTDLATNALAAAGSLVIQVPSSVSSSVINVGGIGLEATLFNSTNRMLYANVGDAFNGADEQNPLVTTAGSDAVVEGKNSYGVWSPLDQGVMVEGTKYVTLKPGTTYRLISIIGAPTFRGQARIRVRYSTTPDATGTISVDYSNVFEVQ